MGQNTENSHSQTKIKNLESPKSPKNKKGNIKVPIPHGSKFEFTTKNYKIWNLQSYPKSKMGIIKVSCLADLDRGALVIELF